MRIVLILAFAALGACGSKPSATDAKKFAEAAEADLLKLSNEAGQAQWLQATYINQDSEAVAARANQRLLDAAVKYAKEAAKYDGVTVQDDVARKLKLLKVSMTLPAPSNAKDSEEVTRLAVSLESAYGKGKYCPGGDPTKCMTIDDITRIMNTSRDPKQLLEVWRGWHTISRPMRKDYVRLVELSNKGAKELGSTPTRCAVALAVRHGPGAFAGTRPPVGTVKPLYVQLHAMSAGSCARSEATPCGPRPHPRASDGNSGAQQWDGVYPLVGPKDSGPGYDLTAILKQRKTDAIQMTRYGEGFFTSLGFAPLPKTFWERSMFTRPRDRDVVCHASAWDVDNDNDLRIKMCIDITADDFNVIHHELGHNFYQRAYNQQPYLFRDSANDGFHEAIGDTVALSITPEYLVKLGLIPKAPDASGDIALLLHKALDKVAFLPFGLLIDQWRWKVFSGEVKPADYNKAWWDLRLKYQGVAPDTPRGEEDFDPGAKYHVPANVPYTRYFLAHLLQFQMHKTLSDAAGCKDPLHRCSIYGNKAAGEKLQSMLEMGMSRPWMDALEKGAGTRQMDGEALRAYFAPLEKWLIEQNKGKPAGW